MRSGRPVAAWEAAVRRFASFGIGPIVAVAMLVASCGGGGPDLTTHAGLHAFSDEVCADLEAASTADAPGVLAAAIAEAVEAGTTAEEAREILNEECHDTIEAIEGAPGS